MNKGFVATQVYTVATVSYSVAYSYTNGRSTNNNIEKGGDVVQLPFLYQAPSVRLVVPFNIYKVNRSNLDSNDLSSFHQPTIR